MSKLSSTAGETLRSFARAGGHRTIETAVKQLTASMSGLERLPDELLEACLMLLGVADRARVLGTCTRLARLDSSASARLWAELRLHLTAERAPAAALWLARRKQHIASLSLECAASSQEEEVWGTDEEPWPSLWPASLGAVLGALAGSQLGLLQLELGLNTVHLSTALLHSLPRLQALRMKAHPYSRAVLSLAPGFAAAAAQLTALELVGVELAWPAGAALPAGLRRLRGGMRAPPPRVAGLESLHIRGQVDPYCLEEFPSLTALCLSGCRLDSVPQELAGLTRLRELRLDENQLSPDSQFAALAELPASLTLLALSRQEDSSMPAVWRVTQLECLELERYIDPWRGLAGSTHKIRLDSLTALTRLTRLRLAGNGLPGGYTTRLAQLRRLKVLELENNEYEQWPSGAGTALPCLPALECLAIDLCLALGDPSALAGLHALRTLRLGGDWERPRSSASGRYLTGARAQSRSQAGWPELQRTLRALPSLVRVEVNPSWSPGDVELVQRLLGEEAGLAIVQGAYVEQEVSFGRYGN